jgi:hypothetical protein
MWRIHYIYSNFSQLIAHPFQRIKQSNINYNLQQLSEENLSRYEGILIAKSTVDAIRLEKDQPENL